MSLLRHRVLGAGFCKEYKTVLAFWVSSGYALPSSHHQSIQDKMVRGWVASGDFAASDFIYVPKNENEDLARTNWKDPSLYYLQKVGSPTFTAGVGWVTNTSNYFLTNKTTTYTYATNLGGTIYTHYGVSSSANNQYCFGWSQSSGYPFSYTDVGVSSWYGGHANLWWYGGIISTIGSPSTRMGGWFQVKVASAIYLYIDGVYQGTKSPGYGGVGAGINYAFGVCLEAGSPIGSSNGIGCHALGNVSSNFDVTYRDYHNAY